MIEKGEFVNLEINEYGNLVMSITKEGKKYARELLEEDGVSSDDALWAMLEDHLSNGWDWILPERIGALTSAPIFSNDCIEDDHGDIISIGHVWGYMDYMLYNPIKQMLKRGSIVLTKGED